MGRRIYREGVALEWSTRGQVTRIGGSRYGNWSVKQSETRHAVRNVRLTACSFT